MIKSEKGTNVGMVGLRNLNFLDLTILGLGSTLGVGVFVLIGELSKNVAGPAIVVSVVVAGLAAALAGLCFAEFGVFHLKADTVYSYSYSCNRENVAFVFGWALALQYITGVASMLKGIIIFIDALADNQISKMLTETVPINCPYVSPYFDFISICIVAALMIFMALGVTNSILIKRIFVMCTLVLLFVIIVAGSVKADAKNWSIERSEDEKIEGGFAPFGILGVIKAAAIMFYGYIGFDSIGISGGEINNIQRNIPLTILVTVFIATIGYIGVGIVLTLMSPYYSLNSYAALPFVFEKVEWTGLKWVIVVGAFFNFQNSLFEAMNLLPRLLNAMANDSLLFHFLRKNHLEAKTPIKTIAVGGLLTAMAAGIFSFDQLANLAVVATMFASTILAVNVILLRYTFKNEETNIKMTENSNLFIQKENFLKRLMLNCFSYTSEASLNVTEKIILGNMIFFCLSCIGLSIILVVYSNSLFNGALEAVLPGCFFICVMIFNIFSIVRQPKFGKDLPFKVPFVPFIPCISIFLNIFLMTAFDGPTWIKFAIWMLLGIIPHITWKIFKNCRPVRESSRYEINRINALKLNDSIWKINLQKRSFYEGTVNLAFSADPEDKFCELEPEPETEKIKNNVEKASLQLKQAEIIQTADLVVEERVESLQEEIQLELIKVDEEDKDKPEEPLTVEEERVQWECVAEIHTEEEFPQESVVLQIVDNTYNFLSEVEDSQKDEMPLEELENVDDTEIKLEEFAEEHAEDSIEEPKEELKEIHEGEPVEEINELQDTKETILILKEKTSEIPKQINPLTFKEELLNEVRNRTIRIKNLNNQNLETNEAPTEVQEDPNMTNSKEKKSIETLIIQTLYESNKSEMINNIMNKEEPNEKQNDYKKIKDFKEKLNQLLKNQINVNSTITKKMILSKPEEDNLVKTEEKEDTMYKSIKTLNKSQIRNELEFLLSKGPPKRPTLRDSFNLKEIDFESHEDEKLKEQKVDSDEMSSKF